ncbi:hypothetical protein D043_0082A, partial [Vibrio parahaemolyticus EKP-021]
MPSHQS